MIRNFRGKSLNYLIHLLLQSRSLPVLAQKHLTRAMSSTSTSGNQFETLAVTNPKPFVFQVELNRPQNFNAINKTMWMELGRCFAELNENPDCRSVVLTASGKHFTAGIDLQDMMVLGQELGAIEEVGRKGHHLQKMIKMYQDAITSLELCHKPIIGASHSAVVGAGVDLLSTVDIRYCTQDCWFQVKEVDIGMAADVGTLQRFPKAIGSQSLARELCFSGRKFQSKEALDCGFVSRLFETKDQMVEAALSLAEDIASKSPIAVQATKKSMVYSLEHTNQEGLDQIVSEGRLWRGWNDLSFTNYNELLSSRGK